MGLHKIIRIVALVFGLAGIATYLMIMLKGDEAIKSAAAAGDLSDVTPIYTVAMIVLVLLLVFLVFFVLKGIASGNIKKTLISIGAFLVVVALGYALSTGSDVDSLPLVDGAPVTESASKWVGTGLRTFYILAIIAIGTMILSGFKKVSNR